jgi:hypothetical protein
MRHKISNPYQGLVDPVLVEIFSGEKLHLNKVLDSILRENQQMGGTMNAFRYESHLYSSVDPKTLRSVSVSDLNSTLVKPVKRYIKDLNQLKIDMMKLRNALSMVLTKCHNIQDCRDALPDIISSKIPEMRGMERIKEEGHVLRNKPELLNQFKQVMEIGLYYQANRLIY